jgi:hypothetical protein
MFQRKEKKYGEKSRGGAGGRPALQTKPEFLNF